MDYMLTGESSIFLLSTTALRNNPGEFLKFDIYSSVKIALKQVKPTRT